MLRGTFSGSMLLAGLCLAAAAVSAGEGGAAGEPAPVHVKLKSLALVHERQYALGDVAEVAGADAGAVRRLSLVALGKAPRLGYTEQLTLEEIQRLVRIRLVGLEEPIVWEGGKAVRIETAAIPYDGRRIVEAAMDHVRSTLTRDDERVEIQPSEPAPTLHLPPGAVSLKPRNLDPTKPRSGRVAVWVDIALEGEFYRSVIVPLRLEIFGTAWVARRNLLRGQVAMPEDFEARRLDLAMLRAEPADPASAFGRRLSRPLAAGEALLRTSLEEVLAVGAGDIVTLQVHSGAVRIESQAVALSAGAVGQIVKIKPGASDAEILAEVLSPGVVKPSSRRR